jgi:metal-responsive CopG/Arc/MetJ family transcriptional regulator
MTELEEAMASKVKITVSLDKTLVQELVGISRQGRKSRSRLVEEALRHWRRSRLEQELKEGYQAMALEDRETAERNLRVGWEAVR